MVKTCVSCGQEFEYTDSDICTYAEKCLDGKTFSYVRCKYCTAMNKMSSEFSRKYDTWVIAYCPDSDSFFATKQRYFFYEYGNGKSFKSEADAIEYFENNVFELVAIRNEIMRKAGQKPCERVFLANTKEFYTY